MIRKYQTRIVLNIAERTGSSPTNMNLNFFASLFPPPRQPHRHPHHLAHRDWHDGENTQEGWNGRGRAGGWRRIRIRTAGLHQGMEPYFFDQ